MNPAKHQGRRHNTPAFEGPPIGDPEERLYFVMSKILMVFLSFPLSTSFLFRFQYAVIFSLLGIRKFLRGWSQDYNRLSVECDDYLLSCSPAPRKIFLAFDLSSEIVMNLKGDILPTSVIKSNIV